MEKAVALVATDKEIKKVISSEDKFVPNAPNKNICECKAEASKGKEKAEVEDESTNQDDLNDIDEYLAFLSRRFSKLNSRETHLCKNQSQLQKGQSTK